MRPPVCLIAAMFCVAAATAKAETLAYGEAFNALYRFGLETHQATEIGTAGFYGGQLIGNISGLTTAADGTLYAAAGGFKLLLRVDPQSGAADVIGSLGLAGQGDPNRNDALDLNMVAGCNGTLWLSSAVADKIWTVDVATGATALVGSTGHTITGLVARDDALFGAGGKGDNNFYRIDPATGAATLVGPFGPGLTHWVNAISMSFDAAGTLWAVVNYVPPQNDTDPVPDWSDLATIDPATGALTIVGPITGPESLYQVGMKGFTIGPTRCSGGAVSQAAAAPVDAPWAILLMALALSAAGVCAARARRA